MKKLLFLSVIFFVTFALFANNSIKVGSITPESTIASGDIRVSATVPDKIFVTVGRNNLIIKDLNYFESFLTSFQEYASIVTENDTTVEVRKQIGMHRTRNYITSSFTFKTNGTGGVESCHLIWRCTDMGYNGNAYNKEIVILNDNEVDELLSLFNEAKSELKRMNEEIEKFNKE